MGNIRVIKGQLIALNVAVHLIRTTVESMFVTVRLRTAKTQLCPVRIPKMIVFKPCLSVQPRWRRLTSAQELVEVISESSHYLSRTLID